MNQEKIKDRILKRAAKLWGYHELQVESSFDPVVSLLLSATASELEKLGFELESSRSRMIEQMLEVMFPEEISGAFPSRSLMQVFPLENCKISLRNHFKQDHNSSQGINRQENMGKDIYFCPTIEADLTTAKVQYIAQGKTIKKLESPFSSKIVQKSECGIPAGEIWVGLYCVDKEELKNLMFYIDINNHHQKELFSSYIRQVKVFSGNQELELKNGYNIDQKSVDFESILNKNYMELDFIYQEVNQYYFSNYFTLKNAISVANMAKDEILFSKYFTETKLSEEEDITWLRFKFPEVIEEEALQNMRFILNCVPVINIYNVKTYRRAKGRLDILPMQSDDHFLALDYVSDETGQRFDMKDYSSEDQGVTVMLRKGGVSRFDKRCASELLQYLLELIKDETAAFAAIGGDSAKEMLVQISQNMAALDQLAKEKNFSYTHNPYLIISGNSLQPEVSYTISYWNTQAEQANHIKPGTFFVEDQPGNLAFERKSLMIHTSLGGRKSLSPQDKILEFRTALLSRGRVVTTADIKEFARSHFKKAIVNVEVSKGTKKELTLKEGFSRTIDVHLYRNPDINGMHEDEWRYLCNSFLLKLKNVSANIFPYRLFEN